MIIPAAVILTLINLGIGIAGTFPIANKPAQWGIVVLIFLWYNFGSFSALTSGQLSIICHLAYVVLHKLLKLGVSRFGPRHKVSSALLKVFAVGSFFSQFPI